MLKKSWGWELNPSPSGDVTRKTSFFSLFLKRFLNGSWHICAVAQIGHHVQAERFS